jgi:anthranilate/para-aminobenzoate synthase component II
VNILLIDNYDSFTFNLLQAFRELGAVVQVHTATTRSRWTRHARWHRPTW